MIKLYMIIYNIIIYLMQPFIWIRLLWRSRKIPEYRKNWLERYAYYPKHKHIKPNSIVLHAVSVGEILSTRSLINSMKQYYPNVTITLTSSTSSGFLLARQLKQEYRNIQQYIYFPYDLPGSIKRFINKIKPKLVIVMETELWPNLINTLNQYEIPFIIINARLSFKSFDKYKKLKHFFSFIMQLITFVVAQNKTNASRFLELGLKKNKLHIIDNLKFNISITQDLTKKILFLKNNWTKGRLTWIASSTHKGEEELLLKTHKQLLTLFPNLLMILAPRHPERFHEVINITKRAGFFLHTKK